LTAAPTDASFSVIIPTLNETDNIVETLQTTLDSSSNPAPQIIISDGGSQDDTLQQAQNFPARIVNSEAGRARQMNTGAALATGDWLLFLHADTRLPQGWQNLIAGCSANWGRFDVRLDGRHWLFRIIEKAINLRSCTSAISSGDQAMFFRRDFFQALGGFPDIELMEDIAISKRARKLGRPACLHRPVITSARRWQQNGILRTILLMWALRLAYWLGVKPATLQKIYYKKTSDSSAKH
jgi:rSAM/selenodomain-associated transferase 2